MKIRNGFVSNSSSSSFVVAFPHKPKDEHDVKEILFGKNDWHYADGLSVDVEIPAIDIAKNVFAKIEKEASKEDIYESIRNGWFDEYYGLPGMADYFDDPEYKDLNINKEDHSKKMKKIWKKYEEINSERAKAIANLFIDFNKDAYIVVMSFSDNNNEAIEEHSDIFRRIEHIRTSYH